MATANIDAIEAIDLTETTTLTLASKYRNGAYLRCPTANAGTVYFGSSNSSGVPVPESDDWADAVLVTADVFNSGGLVVTPSAATQVLYVFPG